MKLATIFSEALHPDIVPAVEKINNKIIEQIRAAGIEIMPAHTDLGASHYTQRPSGGYDYNHGYRWMSSGGWRPSSRWLVGYVKMGNPYIAIYAGLNGDILTQLQNKSGDDYINDHFHRHFKDVDGFIEYLNKKFKPFVASEPLQRFEKFIFGSQPIIYYPIQTNKTDKPGELDDEDEFYNRGGGLNQHHGIVAAATALSEMIKQKKIVDPNNITTMFSAQSMRRWLDESGIEWDNKLEWNNWVAADPKEVYITDMNGQYLNDSTLPREINHMFVTYAKAVARKVASRARVMAAKPPKLPEPPAEQRLLNAIFGDQPPPPQA